MDHPEEVETPMNPGTNQTNTANAHRAAGRTVRDPLRLIRRRLRTIRRAGRTLLAINAMTRFCAVVLLATALLVLLDYAARFPASIRGVILILIAAAAAVGSITLFRPITRYRPPLTDVADRVERWLASRGAPSDTRLSGGVGLRVSHDDSPLTRALARLAAADIAGRLPRVPWGMLRWRRPAAGLVGLIALASCGSLFVIAKPTLSTIGLTRLYIPWSGAEWPRLTTIADATPDATHPSDTPLPLRANLLRSNRAPGEARVTASYRVLQPDGTPTEPTDTILVPQPAPAEDTGGNTPELYERLIDPARWRSTSKQPGADRIIEYTIRSDDDATATRRIRIIDPPVLDAASVTALLPEYARSLTGGDRSESPKNGAAWLRGRTTLPTDNAVVGPILAGSTVSIRLGYSKQVTPDPSGLSDAERVNTNGTEVEIVLTPRQPVGFEILARGEDGFETREPFIARLSVVPDRPPSATMTEPAGTRAVLPSAVIPIAARGEDDLALDGFRIEYLLARVDPDSLSGVPAASEEPVELMSWRRGLKNNTEPGSPEFRQTMDLQAALDIAKTGAVPGDEIWLTAVASDTFTLDGERHDPVESATRRIRIIEESRFIEIIQDELEGIRRTAIALDQRQAEVMNDAVSLEEDPASTDATPDSLAGRQAEIARRLRVQTDSLDALRTRLDENRLEDETARELVRTAEGLAGAASSEAETAAGLSAARARGDRESDPSASQQGVRDALAEMIDRLDRGQDDWVVRRAIERLAESQRALRDDTAKAGEQTVGRDLSELSPDERTELERIADRQRELAEQAQEAIDDLAQRADELRDSDPTQAAALDQAARQAQREQLAKSISDAAEQVAQNQTGTATDLQDESIENLESILEGLENAQRLRDQALRRELASLIQSIESLIRQQRGVLSMIEDDPGSASPKAERLRTNTLAAGASAGGFDEVGPVIDLLERAAAAQLETIRALRAEPRAIEPAESSATEALARLEEALAEAKRQDDNAAQRERERARRELIDAYRAALESQAGLRVRAAAIEPERPTRRDRAELRALGREQESLRIEIASIPETHELPPGGVTDLYHERIDTALTAVVRRFGRGQTEPVVLETQSRVESLLRAIVDVLSPAENQRDPFDDQQAGGGGGGGGGSGQDQPAIGQLEELRLLRSLQGVLLDETRAASDGPGEPSPDLAALQVRIAEQARRIIESMQRNTPNQSPPTPDADTGHDENGRANPGGIEAEETVHDDAKNDAKNDTKKDTKVNTEEDRDG